MVRLQLSVAHSTGRNTKACFDKRQLCWKKRSVRVSLLLLASLSLSVWQMPKKFAIRNANNLKTLHTESRKEITGFFCRNHCCRCRLVVSCPFYNKTLMYFVYFSPSSSVSVLHDVDSVKYFDLLIFVFAEKLLFAYCHSNHAASAVHTSVCFVLFCTTVV